MVKNIFNLSQITTVLIVKILNSPNKCIKKFNEKSE